MANTSLVKHTCRKNQRTIAVASGNTARHTVIVDVCDWDIAPEEVTFDNDNFPYLRLALLDEYLEREGTKETHRA